MYQKCIKMIKMIENVSKMYQKCIKNELKCIKTYQKLIKKLVSQNQFDVLRKQFQTAVLRQVNFATLKKLIIHNVMYFPKTTRCRIFEEYAYQ